MGVDVKKCLPGVAILLIGLIPGSYFLDYYVRVNPMSLASICSNLFILFVAFAVGMEIDFRMFMRVWKGSKVPFIIGCMCQFVGMPVLCWLLTHMFSGSINSKSYSNNLGDENLGTWYPGWIYGGANILGIALAGATPGGTTSNAFTWMVGGDVPLSICMSVVSNLLCPLTFPLLVIVFYNLRFNTDQKVALDYEGMFFPLCFLFVAIGLGMIMKQTLDEKPLKAFKGLFALAGFGNMFAAFILVWDIFADWLNAADSMFFLLTFILQPLGYAVGFGVSGLLKQSHKTRMTVAFETGIQAWGIPLGMCWLTFLPPVQQGAGNVERKGIYDEVIAACGNNPVCDVPGDYAASIKQANVGVSAEILQAAIPGYVPTEITAIPVKTANGFPIQAMPWTRAEYEHTDGTKHIVSTPQTWTSVIKWQAITGLAVDDAGVIQTECLDPTPMDVTDDAGVVTQVCTNATVVNSTAPMQTCTKTDGTEFHTTNPAFDCVGCTGCTQLYGPTLDSPYGNDGLFFSMYARFSDVARWCALPCIFYLAHAIWMVILLRIVYRKSHAMMEDPDALEEEKPQEA